MMCDNAAIEKTTPLARAALITAFVALVAGLVAMAWLYPRTLNPDAVAYLRLAHYVAHDRFGMAVSGYWGPLLTWILAPLLLATNNPFLAARIAMALSAVVFWFGCVAVFHVLRSAFHNVVLGAWLIIPSILVWSVRGLVPDQLVSGLLCLGFALVLSRRWLDSPWVAFGAGLILGVAYLAKAVALPATVLTVLAVSMLAGATGTGSWKACARGMVLTLAGAGLVASPWVVTLSAKYGRPVFSTTARIAHAYVGPGDAERTHATFRIFHQPEPGRLTSWEDPSVMPVNGWSPFDSWAHFRHQWALIVRNAGQAWASLRVFDVLRICLFALVLGLIVHAPWRENMVRERWRWAALPVACLVCVYLPVYAEDPRYFYPALPFLVAAAFGMVHALTSASPKGGRAPRFIGLLLVLASVWGASIPLLWDRCYRHARYQGPAPLAADIAARLESAGREGSIAGFDPYNVGVYVAFFTEQPWFGHKPDASADEYLASGAQLAVVQRGSAQAEEMTASPAFEPLNAVLFDTPEEGNACIAQVFAMHQAQGATQSP